MTKRSVEYFKWIRYLKRFKKMLPDASIQGIRQLYHRTKKYRSQKIEPIEWIPMKISETEQQFLKFQYMQYSMFGLGIYPSH